MSSNRTNTIKSMIPYTTQCYEDILERQKETIKTVLPEYTDLSETDFGVVLLEVMARMNDILSWKIDVAANESLPTKAKTMKAVLSHCKWIGYKPSQNKSAKGTFEFSVINDGTSFVIPKGTQITCKRQNGNLIIFETDESIEVVPPEDSKKGATYKVRVECSHGETITEFLGTSDGSSNQKFMITNTPYVDSSLTLKVVDNEKGTISFYDEAEEFVDMTDNEQSFILSFNELGYGLIELGDGINGKIPPRNHDIYAIYKIGGGTIGNKPAGVVNILLSRNTNGRISYVENVTATTGGIDAETAEKISENAPKNTKVRKRLVTDEDFENYTMVNYGDVIGSCKLIKNKTYVDTYDFYISPKKLSDVNVDSVTKQRLESDLESKCIMGMDIILHDPEYIKIAMDISVTYSSRYSPEVIEESIRYELKNRLSNMQFGEDFNISNIYDTVDSCNGVIKSRVNFLYDKTGEISKGDIISNETQIVLFLGDVSDIKITLTKGGLQ